MTAMRLLVVQKLVGSALLVLCLLVAHQHSAEAQVTITEVVLEDFSDIVTLTDMGFDDFSGNTGAINNPDTYGSSSIRCEPTCFLDFGWDFTLNPAPGAFTGLFFSLFGLINSTDGTLFTEHVLNLDCIDCPLVEPGGDRRLMQLGSRVRYEGATPLTLRVEISDSSGGIRFRRFPIVGSPNTQDILWDFRTDFQVLAGAGDLDLQQAKVLSYVVEREHVGDGVTNPDQGDVQVHRIWFVPDRHEFEPASDAALLDLAERRACQHFLDWSSRKTASFGIPQDRSTFGDLLSIGGVGFGLPAYAVCAERGWITRQLAGELVHSVLTIMSDPNAFGFQPAGRIGHRGWFYHFLGVDGRRRQNFDFPETPQDESLNTVELSTIDTGLAVMGALAAQSYFDGTGQTEAEIRTLAQQVYDNVDWPFMLEPTTNQFSLSWKPNEVRDPNPPFEIPDTAGEGKYSGTTGPGGDPQTIDFYTDEGLLVALLALGSETNPVSSTVYCSLIRQAKSDPKFSGIGTWPGALFTYQFLAAFLDTRTLAAAACEGLAADDWFNNSHDAILAAISYAEMNPDAAPTFGPQAWGISAAEAAAPPERGAADGHRRHARVRGRGAAADHRDARVGGRVAARVRRPGVAAGGDRGSARVRHGVPPREGREVA